MYAKQKQVLESFVRVRTFLEDHPATGWLTYRGARETLLEVLQRAFAHAGTQLSGSALHRGGSRHQRQPMVRMRDRHMRPIEMVSETKHGRLTVFAAPTIAWGHIRVRPCEDRGPDDNCGDLGIQAVLGRRRFLVAGGASLSVLPARLSVVAGVQRLFARQEETRIWIGTVWTP